MTRRLLLFFIASVLLGLPALPIASARSAPPAASNPAPPNPVPPNVVMIVSDDQGWMDFGFMGHPVVKTPNLDRLASRGVLFRRGYVPTSLCSPSLATLITGRYPHEHGITGNDPPRGIDRSELIARIRHVPMLPQLLKAKGYRSFQTGKWWLGDYATGGFSEGMSHGDPRRGGRHGDAGLAIGRMGLKPAFDFIDRCGGRPFFLWYAPMMPHEPHNPPQRLLAKYTAPGRRLPVARYFAMCEWFDETCGELLGYLDRKGMTDNTLVLFVVDNGWAAPDPGQLLPDGKRAPYSSRSKLSPYDGGIRTPILVSWPGRIAPAEYATLVSSIDFAPTILAAAGLPIDRTLPGLNLLDVIAAHGKSRRSAVFGEIYEHDVADINLPVRGLRYRWCVDRNWKLIAPVKPAQPLELYDVIADPTESRNRAKEFPRVAKDLSERLDAWWPIDR